MHPPAPSQQMALLCVRLPKWKTCSHSRFLPILRLPHLISYQLLYLLGVSSSVTPFSKLKPLGFFSISFIQGIFRVFCHLASHQFISRPSWKSFCDPLCYASRNFFSLSSLNITLLFYINVFGHTFLLPGMPTPRLNLIPAQLLFIL